MKRISIDLGKLRETKPSAMAVRFGLGGAITAFAGWIGMKYGPEVAGLFLAFPAIFPASVTLVQKHEEQEHRGNPEEAKRRGCAQAGIEANGAVLGSLGLLAFGAAVWGLATQIGGWLAILAALALWTAVSAAAWILRERLAPQDDDVEAQEPKKPAPGSLAPRAKAAR